MDDLDFDSISINQKKIKKIIMKTQKKKEKKIIYQIKIKQIMKS